ncbi:MFS transporter [Mesorhizobium microcysteis]|uniref:MFS transporter n=1 Tax=Neoaquamicrobium microcysteis TaxID=2682781 RepID=A0A5D4H5H3_9HYPH|nr:MFS transporter [Mesorhizobium microcysteis]TYR34070.1 MFS transporter [Mesorhizobium microcysteis]
MDRSVDQANLEAQPATLVAVASVIVSMALAAVGNGLMFAYIPVRLGLSGYEPTWAGLILTGLSAGGIAGCLLTGMLVKRVGHARAFMIFSALIVLSNAIIGAGVDPVTWIGARALYGFAICGMFIVGQSWLNDAVSNEIRGRVMAVFYVSYILGLGAGSWLMGLLDISGAAAPLIGIAFTSLSILPVGMTRLPPPPPPEGASIAFARAWAISPVGVAGMLAVGGLSMMIAGFAPIHATANGYTQAQVATLMFAMPLGTLLFQLPFGWISDRTDRRYVLVTASLLVVAAGIAAGMFDGSTLAVMILIYMVWSGASESIYSLSSAHANDRASKDDLVALSSTMLFAWSVSGFVVPALGTALTAAYGTQAFMSVAIVIAVIFCAFVLLRIVRNPAVPAEETGSFAPMTAQAPLPVELAFGSDQPEDAGQDITK